MAQAERHTVEHGRQARAPQPRYAGALLRAKSPSPRSSAGTRLQVLLHPPAMRVQLPQLRQPHFPSASLTTSTTTSILSLYDPPPLRFRAFLRRYRPIYLHVVRQVGDNPGAPLQGKDVHIHIGLTALGCCWQVSCRLKTKSGMRTLQTTSGHSSTTRGSCRRNSITKTTTRSSSTRCLSLFITWPRFSSLSADIPFRSA
jgi:hypothetical protein